MTTILPTYFYVGWSDKQGLVESTPSLLPLVVFKQLFLVGPVVPQATSTIAKFIYTAFPEKKR